MPREKIGLFFDFPHFALGAYILFFPVEHDAPKTGGKIVISLHISSKGMDEPASAAL